MGVAVVAIDDNDARAAALAQRLGLPLVSAPADLSDNCVAYLRYSEGGLQLCPADPRQSGPVQIDFARGALQRRAAAPGELIVKAVKGRSKDRLQVVDATAGLGRDAFVLAAHGFELILIERNAVAAALLEDGLMRAAHTPAAPVVARMHLYCGEALAYCASLSEAQRPDVVYLDPMFTEMESSAQVKKEMRLFRQLLGGSHSDERELLDVARGAARLRVVVKRALKAPNFAGLEPAYTLRGKAIRFDIYPV